MHENDRGISTNSNGVRSYMFHADINVWRKSGGCGILQGYPYAGFNISGFLKFCSGKNSRAFFETAKNPYHFDSVNSSENKFLESLYNFASFAPAARNLACGMPQTHYPNDPRRFLNFFPRRALKIKTSKTRFRPPLGHYWTHGLK